MNLEEMSHFLYPYSLSKEKKEQIIIYFEELLSYTQSVNLISKAKRETLFDRHILDCLEGLRFFSSFEGEQKIGDIGSGGGLPGILLGICLPFEIHLVESKEKKCVFLRKIVDQLQLKNIRIHCQNSLEIKERFSIITARGFGTIDKILRLTRPLVIKKETHYILYKGKKEVIDQELIEVSTPIKNPQIINIKRDALERHMVTFFL